MKQSLLHALKETQPSGILNSTKIPSSPSQVRLAKPVDPVDVESGWEELTTEEEDGVVKGVGLKDGGVLAFKFGVKDEDEDLTEEDDEVIGEGEKEGWDVVIPRFQDEFGVENEGDVGVRKEFKG
jgi:hypothetical protein